MNIAATITIINKNIHIHTESKTKPSLSLCNITTMKTPTKY